MHCKNCKYWERETDSGKEEYYGGCSNEKLVDTNIAYIPVDGLGTHDYEGYMSGFRTGENFGCIHFENKN
jgi:hypothetical protein